MKKRDKKEETREDIENRLDFLYYIYQKVLLILLIFMFVMNTWLIILLCAYDLTNLIKGCIIHYVLLFSLFFTYKKLPKFVEVREKYRKKNEKVKKESGRKSIDS